MKNLLSGSHMDHTTPYVVLRYIFTQLRERNLGYAETAEVCTRRGAFGRTDVYNGERSACLERTLCASGLERSNFHERIARTGKQRLRTHFAFRDSLGDVDP